MRLTILITVLFTAMFVVPGCTHFQQTLTGEEKAFPATNTENVQVFVPHAGPQRAFQEVGYIVAEENSEKKAVEFLKKRAAGMGADALIESEVLVYTYVVVFIIIPIPFNVYHASGIAVRYTGQ